MCNRINRYQTTNGLYRIHTYYVCSVTASVVFFGFQKGTSKPRNDEKKMIDRGAKNERTGMKRKAKKKQQQKSRVTTKSICGCHLTSSFIW